ncbi:unnamed protein product [Didymodactylos carnosus]|uniref:Uncharacterized protein n=1 Tax=Didymodactylos carnosus TaxID=1234261 RepID=A0A815MXD1_9BILA|nr:unnamed protein product [Didymodactylos carnosus]CAF4306451.1 unnamed protein product [Didymodactylos carnosus]
MADEHQLIKFEPGHIRQISDAANTPKLDVLKPFFDLSIAIRNATGVLPDNVKPAIVHLCNIHSRMNTKIKQGLSVAGATAAKFVLKCSALMARQMNEKDAVALKSLADKLAACLVTDLEQFIREATDELSIVQKTLLIEASGGRLRGLINDLEKLETQLKEDEGVIEKIELEMNQIEGKIASLKYRISLLEKNTTNETMAKNEMRQELTQLKIQIPDYERVLLQHHNITTKQTRPVLFGLFNRSQDIVTDNGEATAKKNLDELNVRIKILETSMGNWSIGELEKSKTDAVNEVVVLEEQQKELQKENAPAVKKRMDLLAIKEKVCKEIENIYEKLETRNQESIKTVDTLATCVMDATESFQKACTQINSHLLSIDTDADLIVDGIIGAIQLVTLADECNGTATLQRIKHQLSTIEILPVRTNSATVEEA